jgi:hypothetical protein
MIDPIENEITGVEAGHRTAGFSRSWRALALAGTAIAVLGALLRSIPVGMHHGAGLGTFILVAGAVVVTARLLFAPAWRTIVSRPDLLVPVGIVLFGQEVLGWLARIPVLVPILSHTLSGRILGLSLGMSGVGVLGIVLWVSFAAWQTGLLVHIVCSPDRYPLDPWVSIRRGFLPCLATIALGNLVILAVMIPYVALLAVSEPPELIAIIALGSLTVAWNVVTTAVLPIAVSRDGPITTRMKEGFRESWRLKSRLWPRLFAQLLLMGLATFSYERSRTTTTLPGGITSVTESGNSSCQVHAIWVGGYENNDHWYDDAVANAKATPVPVLTWILNVLFLVLAVAMKWTMIRTICGKDTIVAPGGWPGMDATQGR